MPAPGLGGSGVSTYIADISNAQEVVTTTSGGLGEVEVGGPSLSIIPKSGGNTIKGAAYLSGVSKGMVGSNYSDALQAAGLTTPGVLLRQWDFTFGIGGPIKKDRLWYYVTARDEGQYRSIPNIYPNLNASDPTKRLYVADKSREVQGAESWRLYVVRLTYQASARNKFNIHWDEQHPCNGSTFGTTGDGCRNQPESGAVYGPLGLGGLSSTTSPEVGGYLYDHPRVRLLTWSSPVTNRLLFEAGFGAYQAPFGPYESPGNTTRGLARVTEQCAAGCSANGGIPNLTYRSANWGHSWDAQYTWRGSMSYVTGAHNLKIGYGGVALVSDLENHTNDLNLLYTLSNGNADLAHAEPAAVHDELSDPQHVVLRSGPVDARTSDAAGRPALRSELELLARAADPGVGLSGHTDHLPANAWRDRIQGSVAARRLRLRPVREREDIRESKLRQVPGADEQQQQLHPVEPDRPHRDDEPAKLDRLEQQLRAGLRPEESGAAESHGDRGGDICGQGASTFGTTALTTAAIDPKILEGLGRPLQRLADRRVDPAADPSPRVGRSRLLPPMAEQLHGDGQPVRRPREISRPTASPRPLTRDCRAAATTASSGLYNVVPTKFGQTSNNITLANDFGEQYQRYNGMLLNVSARLGAGLTFQGGVNTGKTVQDNCAVRAQLPELNIVAAGVSPAVGVGNPYCHSDPGFITKMTALGSYTLPKIDVLVSGTFRSDQGGALAANWNAPVALVSAALGRPAAVVGNTVPINLVAPGQVWGDRVNALDMRFAKIVRFGRVRNTIGIDLYNITNSAAILTYNQTFNPAATTGSQAWLAPTSVLTPRFMKIGVQIDF